MPEGPAGLELARTDLQSFLSLEPALRDIQIGRIEPVSTGHSGFTYWVDVGGAEMVLRLPPVGVRPVGAADVARQGRIMAAIHAAGLPAPRVVAMSAEPLVDGRPFVLTEKVDGEPIEIAGQSTPPRVLGRAASQVLAELHRLPIRLTGLANEEAVPIRNEMARWAQVMTRGWPQIMERGIELGGLLAKNIPPEREPVLVHGDYSFGNLLFHDGHVEAVIDWEIASLGQRMIDLGSLAVMLVRDRLGPTIVPGRRLGLDLAQLIGDYGSGLTDIDWYAAFSLYKYAAILGFNIMLDRKGRRPDPFYALASTHQMTAGLVEEGIAVMRGESKLI